jgi:acyl-CoA thioester hydrolase
LSELPPYRATIDPSWIDYNGHLRDAYYGLVLSHAIDEVMDTIGLDAHYRKTTRCTLFTLEMHMHYLHEVKADDQLSVETRVLDCDSKRIHLGSLFRCAGREKPVAVAESMQLHVRQGERPEVAPFPPAVAAILEELKLSEAAREAFGPPSRRIGLRPR